MGTPLSERIIVDERPDGVAVITINRPESLNALTRPMMTTLAQAIKRLRQQKETKVIILTGAGRAFSAGVDLTAAQSVFQGDVKDVESDPVVQMEMCPIPIIGAINGHAITAGFEIALACDVLVASTNAKFMDTHSKFGIFPTWGLSQKLPRLIGVNRAREVSLCASPIDAAAAERWGLVNKVVESDALLDSALDIAKKICSNQQHLVKEYKSVINDGLLQTLADGQQLEKDRGHEFYKKMAPEDFQNMQTFIKNRTQRSKL